MLILHEGKVNMKTWYAFAMTESGITKEGPNAGQPYAVDSLVTWQGRVVVTDSLEDAERFCSSKAKVITIPVVPIDHVTLASILAKERFGEHSLH